MTSSFPGTEPAPGLVVSTHLRTAAGSPLPVEVTLTNNAAAPRVLAVGALGVDAAWLPAADAHRRPGARPERHGHAGRVADAGHGAGAATRSPSPCRPSTRRPAGRPAPPPSMVDSTLVVNPRNQLTLELRPRSTSTVSSRKVKLALRNTGNEPARVTLDVKTSPRVRVRFRKKVDRGAPRRDRAGARPGDRARTAGSSAAPSTTPTRSARAAPSRCATSRARSPSTRSWARC